MAEESGRKQRGTGRPWPKGVSGNPAGRPKGSGLAGELRKAIAVEAGDILAALIERAKAGDVQAARALLDRIVPSLKPESAPVHVPGLADAGSLAERAESVLQAVGAGDVPPDVAAALVAAVGALARIHELDEIERRIATLEESHAQ
ncbi:MAG: DUF5681 domain-containing protein [Xanthomonadaceae bacterium]|nr:DUF5681 domain-containing protein [Xanthomonadaceae bacterium]